MRRWVAVVGSIVAAVALGGCADRKEAGGSGDAGLRVGYQRFGGLSLVKARGDAPGVTWSLFESGPALTEALRPGPSTSGRPVRRRRSSRPRPRRDFVIAGVGAPSPKSEAVLVKESKGFKTFADLKGRTVALNKGSDVHWLLVKLLEANKMTLNDINVKYLKPAEGRPAFDNDQVDAWIIWDPYLAPAEQPGVQVLADATGLADNREYLLVSKTAADEMTERSRAFFVRTGKRLLGDREPGRAGSHPRARAEDRRADHQAGPRSCGPARRQAERRGRHGAAGNCGGSGP